MLTDRLRLLRRAGRGVRDAAILAALDASPDAEERAALARALLDGAPGRRSEAAVRALVERWPRLPDDARARAADAPDFGDAVRGAIDAPDERVRLAALLAASDVACRRVGVFARHEPEALDAVLRLADPARPIPEAFDALAECAALHTDAGPARDRVHGALARAAAAFDVIRHRGVILAALEAARRPAPAMRRWLDGADEPGHLALRAAARRLPEIDAAPNLIRWLGLPALAPVAIDRLREPNPGRRRAAALDDAHLLDARGRSRRLAAAGTLRRPIPSDEALDAEPPARRRAAVRWLERAATRDRTARLAARLADGDAATRFLAARALARHPASPESDGALLDFAYDPDPRVARLAAGAIALISAPRRRAALAPLAAPLARSPHRPVRRLATRWLAGDPSGAAGGALDGPALRRALGADRAGTLRRLGEAVRDPDRATSLSALAAIDRLGLSAGFERELIDSIGAGDAFVAARAARSLARTPTDAARVALIGAMAHDDARVVSDAAESFDRAFGPPPERLLDGPSPRVRASAARALLRRDASDRRAGAALAEMLGSEDPGDRRSALWAVERLGRTEMAERVAEIIRSDADPGVADRARRCGRRLLAELRRAWTDRARAASPPVDAGARPIRLRLVRPDEGGLAIGAGGAA